MSEMDTNPKAAGHTRLQQSMEFVMTVQIAW